MYLHSDVVDKTIYKVCSLQWDISTYLHIGIELYSCVILMMCSIPLHMLFKSHMCWVDAIEEDTRIICNQNDTIDTLFNEETKRNNKV